MNVEIPKKALTDAFNKHRHKNRYIDIPCLDDDRVFLHDGLGDNYIHANYVDGYQQQRAFICAQVIHNYSNPYRAPTVIYYPTPKRQAVRQRRMKILSNLTVLYTFFTKRGQEVIPITTSGDSSGKRGSL